MNAPDNGQGIIDSRDVIARIDALESERDDYGTDPDPDAEDAPAEERAKAWAAENPDDAEELATLTALADEASDYAPDWRHGETLIRGSCFEDYARELAENCGMLKDADKWPGNCIDWERAARELQYDYTEVNFGGVSYWVRG